jgi:dipeptidyl aminopeptidase/acylaminoacyl peptidase
VQEAVGGPYMLRRVVVGGVCAAIVTSIAGCRSPGHPHGQSAVAVSDGQFAVTRGIKASVAFSPDGTVLAAAAGDVLRLWNVRHRLGGVFAVPGGVFSVGFSPDGSIVATGGSSGEVRLWNVSTHRAEVLTGASRLAAPLVAFSPAGRILAVVGSGGAGELWNWAARRMTWSFAVDLQALGIVTSVAFSPDGRLLAVAGANGVVQVWDTSTRGVVTTFSTPDGLAFSVAFGPSGRTLAVGEGGATAQLFSLATGTAIATFTEPSSSSVPSAAFSVAFSYDGGVLAVGYRDADGRNGHIRLWDIATATVLATLDATTNTVGYVTSVAFGANDGLLAAGGTDGKIRLWRLRLPTRQRPAKVPPTVQVPLTQ